jgi:hypothetical protein
VAAEDMLSSSPISWGLKFEVIDSNLTSKHGLSLAEQKKFDNFITPR